MENNKRIIYRARRGKTNLSVLRNVGQYGPFYSAIIEQSYKSGEDQDGKPTFETTHWIDERELLNASRLLQIADDVISEAKREENEPTGPEAS